MPPIKHALLGASKAHQWINCPPSARWEQSFPEEGNSEAAAEGTLAHAVAEEHLRRILAGKKPVTSKKLKDDPLYKPVMEEYVDVYTTYIMETFEEACDKTPDALLLLEERVDFSAWVPEGFGTADCILIDDGHMHIFDLKYGKGVPVDAVGNPQIRLYALGAIDAYEALYDIQDVTMHIIQPRLDSITSETMGKYALLEWANEVAAPAAKLADEGKGHHHAGEHCRWCRCRHVCRAYAEDKLRIVALRFKEPEHEERFPDELSREEIAEILLGVDELTRWAKQIKDWALDQAVNHGASFPGFKVVEGRSNRTITDEAKALNLLNAAGFTAGAVTKLKGIGDLEEIVGKKRLGEMLSSLIVKPAGKPVLAKENDKRPAINSFAEAQKVFSNFEEDE